MPEYNPPNNAFYTQVNLPVDMNPLNVMGRGGYKFKKITESTRADYIWYDGKRHVIEVWSKNHRSLQKAVKILRRMV